MSERDAGTGPGAPLAGEPRLAFLILAHQHPAHVARLVARLRGPGAHCFVHVDAKVDAGPFEQALAGSGATLLAKEERKAVHWCGYGMVEATLGLLRHSLADAGAFDRFALLSGADYPLKPLAALRRAAAPAREIVRVDRILDPAGTSSFDRCANRLFLGDIGALNPRSGWPGLRLATRLVQARVPRRVPPGLVVAYGPSWWLLTRQAARHVVEAAERQPELRAFFRWTRSPDEMLVQTILKASPFASAIAIDATRPGAPPAPGTLHATHYVDWDRPNPDAPRTLDLEDVDRLAASEALFARKIDPVRSAALLDRLDVLLGPVEA